MLYYNNMESKLLYSIYVGIKVSLYKLIKGRPKKSFPKESNNN